MKTKIPVLFPVLLLALATNTFVGGQSPKKPISAQGTVVAVQGGAGGEPKLEEPSSVASAVEIWIAHIDHWAAEYKPRPSNDTILIEYRFTRQEELVSEKDLDRNLWNFELWETVGEESKSCQAWITPDQRFKPTAWAKGKNVPGPSKLPCFLLKKRPVSVSHAPTTQ